MPENRPSAGAALRVQGVPEKEIPPFSKGERFGHLFGFAKGERLEVPLWKRGI